jgi:Domain of unknown function (DUF4404)
MKTNQIKDTLRRLHADLDARNIVDPELRELLAKLDADIHKLLDTRDASVADSDSLVERLESLEAEFASEHPAIERFARELIDALGKMGI